MSAPPQQHGEDDGVEPVGQRGRQRDADMGEPADQQEDEEDVEGEAHGGDDDRRAGVLAGEEGGRQHLDEDVGGQADREGRKRPAVGRCRIRAEGAALEEDMDDRPGEGDEGGGGGQRQQQAELDRPVLPALGGSDVAAPGSAGSAGGRRAVPRATPDEAERQLVQPVRVEEIGHGARRQVRGEPGVDHEIDLVRRRRPSAPGQDQTEEAAEPRVPRQARGARPKPSAGGCAGHEGELHDARHGNAPGQHVRRRPWIA